MNDVALVDPGYPDSHLSQVNYKLFVASGLTWVFYGEGSLDDLFAALVRVAPVFHAAEAMPNGLGRLGTRDDVAWTGSEGPSGSAIALFCFPNSDSGFLMRDVVLPTDKLPKQWTRGMGTVGGSVDAPIAAIYARAQARPVWEIAGLQHLQPATDEGISATVPELLRVRLLDAGWEPIDALFRATVPGYAGRTQLLFFGRISSANFALMSPIASSPDDTIPPGLRGRSFGDYTVDAMGGMVLLVDSLPAGPPSPTLEEIHARGLALALFADRVEGDLSVEDAF